MEQGLTRVGKGAMLELNRSRQRPARRVLVLHMVLRRMMCTYEEITRMGI